MKSAQKPRLSFKAAVRFFHGALKTAEFAFV